MDIYKSYGIYGIKNKVNGKVYVGKTEVNFGDRRDCHYACLNGGYGVNKYLQHAWNKYGPDNFEFKVLHVCDESTTRDDINALERRYIKIYKDAGLSYNIGDGGDGGNLLGTHLSDETKQKIGAKNREHMLGRKASEETKNKMSESQKKRYESWTDIDRKEYGRRTSEYASGYKWSDESKKRFSEIQKTHPNAAKYDIDMVYKIRELHESEGLGYTEISAITGVPRPAVYSIATYRRWKYA